MQPCSASRRINMEMGRGAQEGDKMPGKIREERDICRGEVVSSSTMTIDSLVP